MSTVNIPKLKQSLSEQILKLDAAQKIEDNIYIRSSIWTEMKVIDFILTAIEGAEED